MTDTSVPSYWTDDKAPELRILRNNLTQENNPVIIFFYSICVSVCIFSNLKFCSQPLRKKTPYSELIWSAFSRIQTEYGEIRSISQYSARMPENADHNNSKYGHFSRSEGYYDQPCRLA